MRYNFFIIHGIGNSTKGYSNKFQENIRKYFKVTSEVKFYEFLWSNEIIEGENEILNNVKIKRKLRDINWRKWFITHTSDVIAYLRDVELSEKIRDRFREEYLNKFLKQADSINIIVAHSLGSVIAFDTIKDYNLKIDYLFTLGSPLAIFKNDYRKDKTFYKPIKVNYWFNIIKEKDAIAYPLKPLDKYWYQSVTEDIIISKSLISKSISYLAYFVGNIPIIYKLGFVSALFTKLIQIITEPVLEHISYFRDKKVVKIILQKIKETQ